MDESERLVRRWVSPIAIVLILLVGYAFRLGFVTYALYVVLGLIITSRLMGAQSLQHLVHRRRCPVDRAGIGDQVDVAVEARHLGWLPLPWVLLEDLAPASVPRSGAAARVASLWPRQSVTLRYRLTFTRRGYHQLGPLLMESGDLFGLVRRFVAGDSAHYVTVHPRIVPIGEYDISSPRPVGEVRRARQVFEDPTRLKGVRDYQPGDKLSRIHWRATARTGELQTKVFEPSTMLGALICLDLFEAAYEDRQVEERSELGVTAAASLAVHVASANQSVGLLSNGRDAADRARHDPETIEAATRWQAERLARMREESDRLAPFEVKAARGQAVLQPLLDATARVELSDFQPVGAMLLREYPRLPRELSVLILTPGIDEPLRRAVAAMRHSGFTLALLILDHPTAHQRNQGRLLAQGVPSYLISNERSLQQLAAVRL